MLTFEQKQEMIEREFPQLVKKEVSMKRINYHLEESEYDKTVVVQHLHPNGNAFVYVEGLKGYEVDGRGLTNVREATEEQLIRTIQDAIDGLLTVYEPVDEMWEGEDGASLRVKEEEGWWNVYFDDQIEESFGAYDEAVDYLEDEGFIKK